MYEQIAANKRKTIILIVLFFIVVGVIGYLAGVITESGFMYLIIALVYASFTSVIGYFASDKIALSVNGAKEPIEKKDNPYVYRMVENLAITSGLPIPRIYIIDDQTPNAFATGRDPKHASIALTSGIIERLENEELEGVIAHELSHIKNYDIRLMTLVTVLVGTVVLISDYMFSWGFIFGGRRSDKSSSNGVVALVGIIFLILSPLVAQLIKLTVSRKREFLADASGVLLTRYPEGLARALEKIELHGAKMKRANNATAHLFIANPFSSRKLKGISKLFSTHPPIKERVVALRSI